MKFLYTKENINSWVGSSLRKSLSASAFLGLLTFAGCSSKFTDLAPISQRNTESFYKTSGDFVAAVNATYKVLQAGGTYNQSYWVLFEQRSDNTDQGSDGTGLGAELTQVENFLEIATNGIVETAYVDTYKGIARANIVLDRIDKISFDETLKNRLKGEALFLRSLFYYQAAIAFGNIPLELHESVANEQKTQVDAATIYAQLEQDLKIAEGWLPAKYTGSDVGRASKGAAAILLAKVQLLLGKKTEAAQVLRRIITDNNYRLVTYDKLWGLENKNNPESIFEVQFKGGGTGTGNWFTNAFTPLLFSSTGTYKNRPTNEMVKAYESKDLRFKLSMDTIYTNAAGQVITNSRNDARFIVKYGKTNAFGENDASYNFPVFRYADVLLSLAEALGETDESYTLINEIRRRANLDPISRTTAGTFEDKLLRERRIEFAFENHRWPDLLRFKKAESVLQGIGKKPRLLYPIPQRELDINKSFKQNPL